MQISIRIKFIQKNINKRIDQRIARENTTPMNNELTISFEFFKDTALIWLNQGSFQAKITLSSHECKDFTNWLIEDNEESWPSIGLPLPGSNLVDCFAPENKQIAVEAYGFKGKIIQAFKFTDIEFMTNTLEINFESIELTFLGHDLSALVQAAKELIEYDSNYSLASSALSPN